MNSLHSKSTPNPFEHSPFSRNIGLQLVEWTAGRCVVSLEVTEHLRNRNGVAHGGVTATLMDAALGIAARSVTGDWVSEGTVTLNVHYLLPARGRLLAEGRLLKAGKSVAFCDGEVRDETGAVVAKAIATFKIERTQLSDETAR